MDGERFAKAPLPLSVTRTLALHAQALDRPPSSEPITPNAIYDLALQLGGFQIDTLHVVHRSHLLVIWSRLGNFDPQLLNQLAYKAERRRLFEYWKHAACLLPLDEYRFAIPLMRWHQENGGEHRRAWIADPQNQQLVSAVLERIQLEGELRSADFDDPRAIRGTWWDWKPAKQALEYLFDSGQLLVSQRVHFQRLYDLPERILPEWVDKSPTTMEERNRFLLEQAVRALGICHPLHAADYAYLRRGLVSQVITEFLREGIARILPVKLINGQVEEWIVHRDQLENLELIIDGQIKAHHTTFLSPFDSLFWARGRDQALWGFKQTLEAYKPESIRKWGYFCLPMLNRDRLVGRFDPTLDRKKELLTLKALYLEPGISEDEDLVSAVAAALRNFMAFNGAKDLVISYSNAEHFCSRLMAMF